MPESFGREPGEIMKPRQRGGSPRRWVSAILAGAILATPIAVGTLPSTGAGAATSTGVACGASAPVTPAASASTTGITSKSVSVANISIVSGPVPGLFKGAAIGVQAYFAYLNAKGGVNGRKLIVNGMDDGFSGPTNAQLTTTAVANDFALVGDFSLFDNYGCKILAQNSSVPDVSVTLDPGTNALPNVYSAQPLAVGWNLGGLEYWRKKYPTAKVVGTIVSNTATALAQWQGEKAALEHVGYKIAYVDEASPFKSDFTEDVINMKAKGVTAVNLTALDWQVASDFMASAALQNWKPKLIFSGGPVYTVPSQFIKASGGPSVANGVQIAQAQALYLGQDAKSVPAVGQFISWVKKVSPSWSPDLFTLYGWASGQLFAQALQAAGKNPTRGSVLAQLAKIQKFDASGLLAPTNPAKKLPSNCYLLSQIKNGNYSRVSMPKTGFRCDSTYYYANPTK